MGLEEAHDAPGHLIRRLQQIAVAIFLDEFRDIDLTPVQFVTLIAVRDRPGIDQRSLAEVIAIDRSTIGTMLGRLEERGLIARATPPHNKRVKQLLITPAGERLLDASGATIELVQERILSPLSAAERPAFLAQLRRIVTTNNAFSRAPLRIVTERAAPVSEEAPPPPRPAEPSDT